MALRTFVLVALAAVIPSTALAQESGKPPADDKSDAHLRGVELTLRPSVGSAPGESPLRFQPSPIFRGDPGALLQGASPYGAGFVGQGFLGYRFHPVFSAGLRAGIRTSSASAVSDGSTNLSRSAWDAGFYVRGYPLALNESLRRYIDPWFSVGIGYMRDTQSFQKSVATTVGNVTGDVTIDHHAVVIPMAIGIDYRVLPMVSVGPSFEYALASAVAGCAKTSAAGFQAVSYCSNEDPGKQFLSANTYGVWSAGLDVRVTLF